MDGKTFFLYYKYNENNCNIIVAAIKPVENKSIFYKGKQKFKKTLS